MSRTAAARLVVLIVAFAGALRLYHAQAVGARYTPHVDREEGYYEAGLSQLSCHVLAVIPDPAPSGFRAPLYPSFLALTESFFTLPSPRHPRLAQVLLSTLSVAAACLLGWLLFSPLAGILAGALLAFNVNDILEVSSLNVHGFYGSALLALGIALVLWLERRDLRRAGLLGMMMAATILCRPAHWPFPLLFAAACLWRWKFPEGRWRALLPVAAAAALFLLPMSVRNGLQFGSYSPFDFKGAEVLLRSTTGPYLSSTHEQAFEAADSIEPGFSARGLEGRARHEAMVGLALKQMARAPWAYAGYCVQRLYSFWKGLWLYLALGAYALWRLRADRPLEALVLTAASLSGYAAAGGAPEYRVSAVPLLCVIAGAGLANMPFLQKASASPAAALRRLRAGVAVLPGIYAALYTVMVVFLVLELRDNHKPRPFTDARDRCPDGRALHLLKLGAMQAGGRGAGTVFYINMLGDSPSGKASAPVGLTRGYWLERADFLIKTGTRDAAHAALARAESSVLDDDARRRIAVMYRRLTELDRAAKDYRQGLASLSALLKMKPRDSGLWVERAELEALSGARDAALRSAAQAESLNPTGEEQLLRIFELYRDQKEYRRAAASLKPLLKARPKDAGLWLALAEAETRLGERAVALESAAHAEGLNSLTESGSRRIIAVYREQKEYPMAAASLGRLLKTLPADAELWVEHAEVEALAGDRDAALRSAARAESLNPAAEALLLRIFELYRDQKEYRRAAASLKPLLKARPKDAALWLARAEAEMRLGERDAALKSLARAEGSHSPSEGQSRRIIGMYRVLNEFHRAIAVLKPLLESRPQDAGLWLERAELEGGLDARSETLGSLARLEELETSPDERRRMALLYRQMKEPSRALAALKPLLERLPADAELWLERAELEAQTNEKDAALRSLARAEASNLDDDGRRRLALDYQSLGEYGRAIAVLDRLIRQNPGEGTFYSDRGLCRHLNGDAKAAITDLEKAIALEPRFLPAYLTLGAVLATKGRREEALAVYDAGLAREPDAESAPLRAILLAERERILPKGGR